MEKDFNWLVTMIQERIDENIQPSKSPNSQSDVIDYALKSGQHIAYSDAMTLIKFAFEKHAV